MLDIILTKLKKSGYKTTPQRREIIQILVKNAQDHLSLNSFYDILKEKMPMVSFSTLYNTLQTLEKLAVLRLFNFKGETRIEMNMDSHINLIQQNDNTIIDIRDDLFVIDIAKKLNLNDNSKVILVNVILYDKKD